MSAWPGNEASDENKWNWLHSECSQFGRPWYQIDQPWLRQKEVVDWLRDQIKANCLPSLRSLKRIFAQYIDIDELVSIAWEEVFRSDFDLSTNNLKSCIINICNFSYIRYMRKHFFFTKRGPQKNFPSQIDFLTDSSPPPDEMFERVDSAAIAYEAIHGAFKILETSKYGICYPERILIAKETLLGGEKPRNIAERFGVTPQEIASITYRVFKKLRKILKKNPPPGWH